MARTEMRLHIPKGRNIISDVYQEQRSFALSAEQKNQLAFMNNGPLFFLFRCWLMMMMRCSLQCAQLPTYPLNKYEKNGKAHGLL
jgi:hypothetical protein